ncbi:MAG: class I SAM-dependent RNA methyltransferase [Bacteroidetes bacterium]|nr:class I SAM-dependent RNA methyltransferase [Bacteroidota bacterium]
MTLLKLVAKTQHGLEDILANEIRDLGAEKVKVLKRAVEFEGDQRMLYRANLELRTAIRILIPIYHFGAKHENELYKKIRQVDWSQYMDVDDTLSIGAVTHSNIFKHSQFAALKTKDAIVDQFRQNTGRRPNVDINYPTLRLHLHIHEKDCTISLDSSGDSLHKRGYRADAVEAPLNEVLAAGMILLSGWKGDRPFIDPMCGSGTLPIEAALIAHNIPPNYYRKRFGFQRWKDFDRNLWDEIMEQAKENIKDTSCEIYGFDKDFKAAKISQHNIFGAHLEGKINVSRQRFERLEPPVENGFMMMNPPYDVRLTDDNILDFYKMIGDRLKQHFNGYEAWILSGNLEAIKHIGLRPSRKISLYNGALECKFQKFELYAGSKKSKAIKTKS